MLERPHSGDAQAGGTARCLVHVAHVGLLKNHHARLLDESERARLEQYRFEEDRRRFILGAVLARSAAAEALQTDAATITLDRTCPDCGAPHGKPSVVGGGPHISVSHSRDVVLVAVTPVAPVGVDIEVIDGGRMDYRQVLPSVCGPDESAFVTDLADFLTYWTRKEAVLKATGHGLRLAMSDVVVSPPGRAARLESFPSPGNVDCRLTDLDLGDGYAAAVAVLTSGPVEVEVVDASLVLALA